MRRAEGTRTEEVLCKSPSDEYVLLVRTQTYEGAYIALWWVPISESYEASSLSRLEAAAWWGRTGGGDLPPELRSVLDGEAFLGAPSRPAKKCGGRDQKLEARDKWIYEESLKGRAAPWKKILAALKEKAEKTGWSVPRTVNAVRQAAIKHAQRSGLPPPPNRIDL
jgi:hypothetical protein